MTPEELADKHWQYVESVIKQEWYAFEFAGADASRLDAHTGIISHHYKTAFIHGYKHGIEAALEAMPGVPKEAVPPA